MNDNDPTIVEALDFVTKLMGDAVSLVKEDRAVIVTTIKGAPERISDVAARIHQGRKYLRMLDEIFEGAETVCCDACEEAARRPWIPPDDIG